jgi:hypothetical protein
MTRKLTAHKHVCVLLHRNRVPTELYSDRQLAVYFLRTLWKLLRSLGYGEPPLFIGTPSLLQGTTYLWNIWVMMYEKLFTYHICRTRQVMEATAPRMLYEASIQDAAC